ncbi:hypothetical protein Tco_1074843 [Tanacetum coccineum]
MKGGTIGGDKRGSSTNDQNATKESLLSDFLTFNSILRKTNISNASCSMNAEKAAEHGTNDVNRVNSSQQFTYAKVVTPERVKSKVNLRSLEYEVGDVDADLIIPMTSIQEVNERFENSLYGHFIGKHIAYPFALVYEDDKSTNLVVMDLYIDVLVVDEDGEISQLA